MASKLKLTYAQRAAILRRYEEFVCLEQLVVEFGFCRPTITRIIREVGGVIRERRKVTEIDTQKPQTVVPSLFKAKIAELTARVGGPLDPVILKTLVDYSLGFNDGRTFRKIDRKLDLPGTMSQFRKEHLEGNYYIMGRLWRAVYRHLAYGDSIEQYGVTAEDVQTCLDHLSPEIEKEIIQWTLSTDYVYLPNEQGVQSVVKDCEQTIKTVVNKKLRFIANYDPCYEKEDLEGFLRIIAYKVATQYDWEIENGKFAYARCLNFTKRSLWNASSLFIKQNTSENYRRIVRTDSDVRTYDITTLPLEENHVRDLADPMAEMSSFEVKELVQTLSQEDPAFAQYLNLEFEDVPAFSEFVMKSTGQEENALYTSDFEAWRELAMRFSGITKASQRKAIKRRALKGLGIWDESKVKVEVTK